MLLVSKFFSDIMKTAGSSGIQMLITVITTPLMTRLYEPAAYSAFGVLHTMAISLIGVGLLSLPNAYPIEKDPAKRMALIQVMLLLLLVLVLLAVVAAAVMLITGALEFKALAVIMLPIVVLTFGIRQIMVSIAIERAHFNTLSVGNIIEPLCSRGGSIFLGALVGGRPAFILMSVALGHLATTITVSRMVVKKSLSDWRVLFQHRVKPFAVLKEYSDFIVYSNFSQQAQPLALLAVQLIIIACFSHDTAGQYILAVSILTLPSSVVALATAPVVYHDLIERERSNPAQLGRYMNRATACYVMIGALMLSPVFFFGEELFKFVFGSVWGPAGKAASMLSVAYVGSFALAGVQSIFRVTRRLKAQFFLEVLTCAAIVIAVALSFEHLDFNTAILYLSIIWAIRNMILLCACIMVANEHADPIPRAS